MTLYTRFDWLRWKMFTQIYILSVGRPTHRSSFLLTPSVRRRIKSVDLKRSLTPFFASCSYTTRKISEIPQDHTNSEICLQRLSKAEMNNAPPGLGHKMLSPFFSRQAVSLAIFPFFQRLFPLQAQFLSCPFCWNPFSVSEFHIKYTQAQKIFRPGNGRIRRRLSHSLCRRISKLPT